ncbi:MULTISPECIES: LysR family transcriptional regulator [Rhizobium]|uniref:LysR family transcriptional regulator n=1 Tax=Rhizobium TaxID=379 RepID=UPI001FEFC4C9|nr:MULTISPECIES: LysR family transcriptional regulator [Rhizobium]
MSADLGDLRVPRNAQLSAAPTRSRRAEGPRESTNVPVVIAMMISRERLDRIAEELVMTQAAVSYQIKLLEDRLGAKLFVRRSQGVVSTEAGQRIAPNISEAFNLLPETFDSLERPNRKHRPSARPMALRRCGWFRGWITSTSRISISS